MRQRFTRSRLSALLMSALMVSCLEVAEERAQAEERVGSARYQGLSLRVDGGDASIRTLSHSDGLLRVDLWAQTPQQGLTIRVEQAAELPQIDRIELTWHNIMPKSQLVAESPVGSVSLAAQMSYDEQVPTLLKLELPFEGQELRLQLTPPQPPEGEPWRFGLFADVQERIDGLEELLSPLGQEPLEFCLISGDLTSQGRPDELELFQRGMERRLSFPCYATLGNHELGTAGPPFHQYFGRGSYSFSYGGARFSLLDDASATLAPQTLKRLQAWLREAGEPLHIVATHLPILDVDGTRSGSFASRLEAAELLSALAKGGVDLLLYGHVHTYRSFRQAGMAAVISGGGGSIPMRFDGVGRHYVIFELDASRRLISHRLGLIEPED